MRGKTFRQTRRGVLALTAGLATIVVVRPARSEIDQTEAAIRAFAGDAKLSPGKVHIDVPPLVENGNSVPVTVTVDSPMTAASHVRSIALFNEKNPQADVAIFKLGPRSGRAAVSTRIRLATTQQLTAVAQLSDGTFWSDKVEVIVTIAACTES